MECPLLYLPKYFDKHNDVYYYNLIRVRKKNDINRWLHFFLIGVRDTSTETANTIGDILQSKESLENKIHHIWGRRTRSALILIGHLFKQPSIDVKAVENACDLSQEVAGKLVDSFEDEGILV